MQPGTQTAISLLFLVGSVVVSLVTVQGNFSPFQLQFTVPSVLQNFEAYSNKYINKHIVPDQLKASYKYLAMSSYFGRADVALPGFAKYFKKASERELDNAYSLMSYVNTRGGMVKYRDIRMDLNATLFSGKQPSIDAFKEALTIERGLNKKILDLHSVASKQRDAHLKHTLEDRYMEQKVDMIKEYGDHLAVLQAMRGDQFGLGEYTFDNNL